MHHTPVGSPPAVVRTDQDWQYSPPTDTPSGRLSNHLRAPRIETPLLWREYNNPPVELQGNPVPAMASPHVHQFAAAPPNVFVPPPVVHPQGPAPNHSVAGPYAIRPTAHGTPATTTISDRWSPTCTICTPSAWATRWTALSTNATRPSRPAHSPRFHSQSSIPDLWCTLPILHCPASRTPARAERQQFRGSETGQVHREGSEETQVIYFLMYYVL